MYEDLNKYLQQASTLASQLEEVMADAETACRFIEDHNGDTIASLWHEVWAQEEEVQSLNASINTLAERVERRAARYKETA